MQLFKHFIVKRLSFWKGVNMCDNILDLCTVQYIHKPKLILKPDFSFCIAIDKTCRLTPSPTAASPIKIKMNTDEEYKQPHYIQYTRKTWLLCYTLEIQLQQTQQVLSSMDKVMCTKTSLCNFNFKVKIQLIMPLMKINKLCCLFIPFSLHLNGLAQLTSFLL